MSFEPRYGPEEVRRLVAQQTLGPFELYWILHQHPLNQLTHCLGIPLVIASVIVPVAGWFAAEVFLWQEWLLLGAAGWAFQFLGHWVEGNAPAFVGDVRQLLIGPLFFLLKPYVWVWERRQGRPYYAPE